MNEVFAVGGLLSAFGLSSASGLNAGLPLLVVGLAIAAWRIVRRLHRGLRWFARLGSDARPVDPTVDTPADAVRRARPSS